MCLLQSFIMNHLQLDFCLEITYYHHLLPVPVLWHTISYFFSKHCLLVKDLYFISKTRRKPGVWYGFPKPVLVLANDVIFLATSSLSKDCTKCVQWIESQLSASQCMFSDYGPRLRICRPRIINKYVVLTRTQFGYKRNFRNLKKVVIIQIKCLEMKNKSKPENISPCQ